MTPPVRLTYRQMCTHGAGPFQNQDSRRARSSGNRARTPGTRQD